MHTSDKLADRRSLIRYALVRAQIGVEAALEKDLMDIMQTFRYADASMVVLDTTQAYMMALILFKSLADIALPDKSWKRNFEACCQAIGETSDTIDACIRVLRVAST